MARIPRRLRNLNLPVQDAENIQLDEDGLQGPPEIDNILPRRPHESTSKMKIVWPNGEMRQIVGEFRVKHLSELKGGKVIIETDENGVPNERSSSILGGYIGQLAGNPTFAPLHISRWDNKLFNPIKLKIIRDVEEKFVYPLETKQLTRDWVLMTANKRWRAYKSRLKQKYFNPDERSLDEILKDVPTGVNENQWETLVGTWCQDSHMKLCDKNSYCGKQQKNSHTTGRKSHARLLKEMETKRNGKVSKIELWDEAHKRKDENCTNENAKTKKLKLRGYYDDKFWSNVKVSQGLTFIEESETQGNVQFELRAIGDNVEDLKDELKMMRAFIAQKFPGEDYRNAKLATENEVENEIVDANDIRHETNENPKVSSDKEYTPSNTLQQLRPNNCTRTTEGHANLSLPHEHMVAKKARTEICATSNQLGAAREQFTIKQLRSDNCTGTKETCANSSLPYERMIAKKVHTENCAEESALQRQKVTIQDKFEVFLFSTIPRNKNKVVARATLVSTDKTYVVGGNMLGDEYYAVYVRAVFKNGDERLLREYDKFHTVRDAIGSIIAWPRSYVKKRMITDRG